MNFKTEKILAEVSTNYITAKRLTLTSWNGYHAKLDLRLWSLNQSEPKPEKGITLTDEEARVLAEALNTYLAEEVQT